MVKQSKTLASGSILDLLNIRRIQDDCLIFEEKRGHESYAAVVKIDPIGFSLMSEQDQEAVLEGYRVFLHRLSVGESLSIHVRVLPYDLRAYLTRLEETRREMPLRFQKMSLDHERFVRDLASQHAILQREFYVRIQVSPQSRKRGHTKTLELAKGQLHQMCLDIQEDASRCGLSSQRLGDSELARYYQSCIHAHYAAKYPLKDMNLLALDLPVSAMSKEDMQAWLSEEPELIEGDNQEDDTAILNVPLLEGTDQAERTKGQTHFFTRFFKGRSRKKGPLTSTPYTTLIELLQPATITHHEHFLKIHKEESEYFRARSIVGYPAYVVPGWLDRLLQIDEPFVDVVIYISTLDPKTFTDHLTRKLTGLRATQTIESRAGRTENPYIQAAREEVELLRERIVRQEEKVHTVSIYIASRASNVPELKQRDEKILSLLRSLDIESVECSLEHLQAWLSLLPDTRDILKREKILDTSSVVTAFPFGSTSLSTKPGILTGVTPDGNMVIVDPFSPLLENANEVKFAKSGSGKSFDEKVRLSRFLQMGIHCIVVDPENEFERLREAYDGIQVSLSAGQLALNPFYLAPTDSPERDVLEEKINSLLTLFDLLIADRTSHQASGVLSQTEKAALETTIRHAYSEAGMNAKTILRVSYDRELPTMADIHTYLKKSELRLGSVGLELAHRLSRYVHAFPHETDRNLLKSPLVVFSMRDLPDDLRPVALFLISDYVWTQVRRERHPRPRLLSIDEAWTLLQFDAGGRALATLTRRARKYNLGVRITTQLVNDFLASDSGQAILANANKLVLKTDAANIDTVAATLKLTESEKRFLLGAKKGEGLYFLGQAQGQAHVPLRVVASELEYDLANTNAQELRQQARKQEMTIL